MAARASRDDTNAGAPGGAPPTPLLFGCIRPTLDVSECATVSGRTEGDEPRTAVVSPAVRSDIGWRGVRLWRVQPPPTALAGGGGRPRPARKAPAGWGREER